MRGICHQDSVAKPGCEGRDVLQGEGPQAWRNASDNAAALSEHTYASDAAPEAAEPSSADANRSWQGESSVAQAQTAGGHAKRQSRSMFGVHALQRIRESGGGSGNSSYATPAGGATDEQQPARCPFAWRNKSSDKLQGSGWSVQVPAWVLVSMLGAAAAGGAVAAAGLQRRR